MCNPTSRYDSIFKQSFAALYCYACKIVNDPVTAQDIVQSAYLTVRLTYLEKFYNAADQHAYLTRAVKFQCFKHFYSQKRFRQFLADYTALNSTNHEETRTCDEQLLLLLTSVIARLPERQHTAIRLKYIEGKSIADIAAAMQIDETSVGRYLTIAKHRLKKYRRLLYDAFSSQQ